MAKLPTFAAAREMLLTYLVTEGWAVVRWRNGAPLKTPHATNPEGTVRFWFKAQAVWYTTCRPPLNRHEYGNARSLWVDIRSATGPAILLLAKELHAGVIELHGKPKG